MVIHIQKDFFCKNGMYVSCVCAPIVPVCPYLVCVLFSLVNKCSALSPEFINLLAYSFDFSVFISPVFCLLNVNLSLNLLKTSLFKIILVFLLLRPQRTVTVWY